LEKFEKENPTGIDTTATKNFAYS